MRVLVTGSTGLVGVPLQEYLQEQGHTVVQLVRKTPQSPSQIFWSPEQEQINTSQLNGFDAVIHLAGDNIAQGRWTAEKKERIRNSRVQATQFLCRALAQCSNPPRHFLSASAIGCYGNRGDEILTEESTLGHGFLEEVAKDWESATQELPTTTRVVFMRFGIILSAHGGALAKMLLPFRMGTGGKVGNGKQYMSWIAITDTIRAISFLLDSEESGAFNMVAPHPVTNLEFTKMLGEQLSRPTLLPLPAFAVKTLFGEMGETLLLGSARVLPQRLQQANFQFLYPDLPAALRQIVS